MSLEQKIQISGHAPDPAAMAELISERNVNPIIGGAVVATLKAHFLELNDERHGRFPGNVTGFYATAADATYYTNEGGEAAVNVAEPVGLRQRLLGGLIEPKEKDYLAIPNYEYLDVTHGKSPLEFDNLTILFGYQQTGQIGPIGLITKQGGVRYAESGKKVKREERDSEGRKQGIEEGEVLFWLKMFVIQDPDPSVLPPISELEQAGYEAAAEYLGQGFTTGYQPWNTPD